MAKLDPNLDCATVVKNLTKLMQNPLESKNLGGDFEYEYGLFLFSITEDENASFSDFQSKRITGEYTADETDGFRLNDTKKLSNYYKRVHRVYNKNKVKL
jgi:hypothetical protein